jgi:hypothetical protein
MLSNLNGFSPSSELTAEEEDTKQQNSPLLKERNGAFGGEISDRPLKSMGGLISVGDLLDQ